jgi:aquaporin Z
MTDRLRAHWREYASELVGLAAFMVAAAAMATLLQHPASPLWQHGAATAMARLPMGVAMGITAAALIYSPLGQRSGAHLNPAVTLTFLRLRKIQPVDAVCYVIAQFAGGAAGIAAAAAALRPYLSDPAVDYVATRPGQAGAAVAFVAEGTISFGLMLLVLACSNHPRAARYTGVCAGALIALYITVEAPLSGMSMNAARSFGSAAFAGALDSLWLYATAPLAGMLLAAEIYIRRHGAARVRCAKLHHPVNRPCIFCSEVLR